MRKLFLLIVSCIFTVSVFAQSKTTSCKIEGVPGAYITAELQQYVSAGGSFTTKVILRSFGVKDAAVTVELTGENRPASGKYTPFREEGMGYIENGKGEVNFNMSRSRHVEVIKIYNAVCR